MLRTIEPAMLCFGTPVALVSTPKGMAPPTSPVGRGGIVHPSRLAQIPESAYRPVRWQEDVALRLEKAA